MKIAYCGFDYFATCLEMLIEQGHEILSVFSESCERPISENNYICEICKSNAIEIIGRPIDNQALQALVDSGCDLIVSAAYDFKVPELSAHGLKGINIHPTILPEGKGVWPLPWIILKQLEQGGITIHRLEPKMDSGSILFQNRFPLTRHERLETLSAKVQMHAKAALREVINGFDKYWDNARPQSGEGSYWPRPQRQDRQINWHSSLEDIERLGRAFGKTGCYGTFDNKDWVVYALQGWPEKHVYEVGSVVHKTSTEMIVAAADGLVSLIYFEPDKSRDNNRNSEF